MESKETSALLGVGLLFVLAGRLIAIPLQVSGQVVELRVHAIPLIRESIRGVAFHEGLGLVVLRLRPSRRDASGSVMAIVLEHPGFPVRCALAVDGLAGMARLCRTSPREGAPAWSIDSVDEDGRAVDWIDIVALLQGVFTSRPEPLAPVSA